MLYTLIELRQRLINTFLNNSNSNQSTDDKIDLSLPNAEYKNQSKSTMSTDLGIYPYKYLTEAQLSTNFSEKLQDDSIDYTIKLCIYNINDEILIPFVQYLCISPMSDTYDFPQVQLNMQNIEEIIIDSTKIQPFNDDTDSNEDDDEDDVESNSDEDDVESNSDEDDVESNSDDDDVKSSSDDDDVESNSDDDDVKSNSDDDVKSSSDDDDVESNSDDYNINSDDDDDKSDDISEFDNKITSNTNMDITLDDEIKYELLDQCAKLLLDKIVNVDNAKSHVDSIIDGYKGFIKQSNTIYMFLECTDQTIFKNDSNMVFATMDEIANNHQILDIKIDDDIIELINQNEIIKNIIDNNNNPILIPNLAYICKVNSDGEYENEYNESNYISFITPTIRTETEDELFIFTLKPLTNNYKNIIRYALYMVDETDEHAIEKYKYIIPMITIQNDDVDKPTIYSSNSIDIFTQL